MSKYANLQEVLKTQTAPVWSVKFSDIENLLSFKLPKSAYTYPAWWSNDGTSHSHSRSWLEIGWKTESVDVKSQRVTFRFAGKSRLPPSTAGQAGPLHATVRYTMSSPLTDPIDVKWDAAN